MGREHYRYANKVIHIPGGMSQGGSRFHHDTQNCVLFEICEMFISGIFHLILVSFIFHLIFNIGQTMVDYG